MPRFIAASLVMLVVASAFADAVDDPLEYAARWATFRTDPATWSTSSGFGLRWGMGIADVKEKYPGADKVLNGVIKGPVEGTQRYSVVNNVEDMRVELQFGFLEGRLNKVVVASMILEDVVRDSLARRPWPSDKEKEEREKNAWYWRKRVYDVLIAKYGPPLQAPDAPTLRRFCDRVPGGCVYGSEAATALQWTWRSGETIIVLHGGAAPELSYVDARVEQKVEEMLKVQSDGWRKTQEDQKAADRSRL